MPMIMPSIDDQVVADDPIIGTGRIAVSASDHIRACRGFADIGIGVYSLRFVNHRPLVGVWSILN
ncbi:hypothetical protein [Bifidobacterium margollesii]|uniref:hypothetical protein n=1 Tax=Bifidobacterium margollesii TaxID=2020964 RepID=UPI0010561DF3|nr:hypothetical protein [Bifidobacterium margollesii]